MRERLITAAELSTTGERQLAHLGEPQGIASGIAEAGVDPIGTVLGLFGELDAAALELLIGGLTIVCG
jgi:hypothetical protein